MAAEGASCAARAVPSDSVSCMLAARRVPTGRFADGVPGAGREPSASVMTKREQRGSVSPATRLQRSQEIWVTTIRLSSARMGAFLLAAAEAATALGTGGGRLCEAAAATDAACERRRPQRRPPTWPPRRRPPVAEAATASTRRRPPAVAARGGGGRRHRRRRSPPRRSPLRSPPLVGGDRCGPSPLRPPPRGGGDRCGRRLF